MQLSPFDPSTIYIGANMVLKSADQGRSYQPISPDLTTNTDREALSIMGVVGKEIRIAKHDGVGSLRQHRHARGDRRRRPGVVWAGSDDGVVSVTQDAGKTWTNVTAKIPGVPKFTYVSDVVPSRAAAGTAYVTFDGHRGGDYATYVFTTTDFGAPGDRSPATCRRARWRGRLPRTGRTPTCSTSAPRPACGCRGTRAASGRG